MRRQFLFILISLNAAFASAETYVTHMGATFNKVSTPGFGDAWKAPNGVIWSGCIGEYSNQGDQPLNATVVTHSPATNACEARGGNLPLLSDYKDLVGFFMLDIGTSTPEEATDFIHLFPGCHNPGQMPGWFWTADAMTTYARAVQGWDAYGDLGPATASSEIRCIVRPTQQ